MSHGHSDCIKKLSVVDSISQEFRVIIKNNKKGDSFDFLKDRENIFIIDEQYGNGFARNNNIVFEYCFNQLSMKKNDLFLVLNPDVVVSLDTLKLLKDYISESRDKLSTINLYRDSEFKYYDNAIRQFPEMSDFFSSFLLNRNKTIINKSDIQKPQMVDWAAGSFLVFNANHYIELGGFDESYFMYCEDIDICLRSNMIDVPLKYLPQFRAVHLAKHNNRKVFSKHFYWHLKSILYYLLTKYSLRKAKSEMTCG
ncbi:glycosyltransferase family 2 protein [Aliivibrio fischeri]|uniref:glycosyltransferase family 2 protein n=1 Tax=Aliivibrio fischeri TaxID=668 RepID=UPI001F21D118|nr:glycosyltransferase family 2 protein [Aliivibrio fischeri]